MVCFYVISSGPVTQVSVKAGLIFFTAIRWQIWLILDPSPLQNADVLNGWSHTITVHLKCRNNPLS